MRPWIAVSLGLILGGALGNLADRVANGPGVSGRVTDFIDLQVWPIFNLADTAIVIGAVILAVASFDGADDHAEPSGASGPAATGSAAPSRDRGVRRRARPPGRRGVGPSRCHPGGGAARDRRRGRAGRRDGPSQVAPSRGRRADPGRPGAGGGAPGRGAAARARLAGRAPARRRASRRACRPTRPRTGAAGPSSTACSGWGSRSRRAAGRCVRGSSTGSMRGRAACSSWRATTRRSRRSSRSFKRHEAGRAYLALVRGAVAHDRFEVDAPLGRAGREDPGGRDRRTRGVDGVRGARAVRAGDAAGGRAPDRSDAPDPGPPVLGRAPDPRGPAATAGEGTTPASSGSSARSCTRGGSGSSTRSRASASTWRTRCRPTWSARSSGRGAARPDQRRARSASRR